MTFNDNLSKLPADSAQLVYLISIELSPNERLLDFKVLRWLKSCSLLVNVITGCTTKPADRTLFKWGARTHFADNALIVVDYSPFMITKNATFVRNLERAPSRSTTNPSVIAPWPAIWFYQANFFVVLLKSFNNKILDGKIWRRGGGARDDYYYKRAWFVEG